MSTNRLPPLLNEMATFARVVETGSFSEAARQLGATPSAVSRSVARLEKTLKTRLLQRTTRKLRLSDSGIEVYRHCQEMMQSARAILDSSANTSSEPSGKVRVSVPRALGRFFVHPHIPEFLARYPEVDIVLRLDDGPLDLVAQHVDVAFIITDAPPPGVTGRRLIRIEQIICATPSYLERHGTPAHPRDLKHHSCIALGEEAIDSRWKFSKNGKSISVDIEGRYTANHTGIRLDAVLHDLGIGGIPHFIARDALQDGRVVQVLPEWTYKANFHGDVWITHPAARHLPPRIRAFIAFMAEKLQAQEPSSLRSVAAANSRKPTAREHKK